MLSPILTTPENPNQHEIDLDPFAGPLATNENHDIYRRDTGMLLMSGEELKWWEQPGMLHSSFSGSPRDISYVQVGNINPNIRIDLLRFLSTGVVEHNAKIAQIIATDGGISRGMTRHYGATDRTLSGGVLIRNVNNNHCLVEEPDMDIRMDHWRRQHSGHSGNNPCGLGSLPPKGFEDKLRMTDIAHAILDEYVGTPQIDMYGETSIKANAKSSKKPLWVFYENPRAFTLQFVTQREAIAMIKEGVQDFTNGLPITNWGHFIAGSAIGRLLSAGFLHHGGEGHNFLIDLGITKSGSVERPSLIMKDFELAKVFDTSNIPEASTLKVGIERLIESVDDGLRGTRFVDVIDESLDKSQVRHIRASAWAHALSGFRYGLGVIGSNDVAGNINDIVRLSIKELNRQDIDGKTIAKHLRRMFSNISLDSIRRGNYWNNNTEILTAANRPIDKNYDHYGVPR
jgi:hypothetical protein